MLTRFKQSLMPLSISQAHELVISLYDKDSRTRRWFRTPLAILMGITGDIPVNRVTRDHIKQWEEIIQGEKMTVRPGESTKRSAHTIDSYKRAMRAFFNHLVDKRCVKESPAVVLSFRTPPEGDPKHLEPEEVTRLMETATGNVRDFAMLHVLRASGIRLGGLVSMTLSSLKIEQIEISLNDLKEDEAVLVELAYAYGLEYMLKDEYAFRYDGEFVVIEKGQHGRKASRFAYLDHEACIAVLEYLKIRPHDAPDELWLATGTNRPITENTAYHAFKTVADNAGIDCSPHDMRHTFATELISNGVDMKIASRLLGHKDFRTTMRVYYNPKQKVIKETYRQVSKNRYNKR